MQSLRSFLCGVYAFVSLTILWGLLWSSAFLLHPLRPRGGHWALAIIARLFLPGVAFVFGLSGLSYWRHWRSAKFWGLAAAALNVAVPFFIAWVLSRYAIRGAGSFFDNLKMSSLLLGVGVLGFIAFWKWSPSSEDPNDFRPTRVAGDGTNPIFDKLFWVVAIVGYLFGMQWWARWGYQAHLPRYGPIPGYIAVFIAELAVVLVHEAGHALCGLWLGMKLRAFIVGPFQWRVVGSIWKFSFRPAQFFATGGSTAVVPTVRNEPGSHDLAMTLAGPLASLAGGLAGFWIVLQAPGHAWESWWRLLAMFTTISLLAFIGNLLPMQTSAGHYSDGAHMFQILSGGPWADHHRVWRIAGATTVSALRPRDFDIGAIQRAGTVVRSGPRAFLLHLLANSYYLDTDQPASASYAVHEAEQLYDECVSKMTAEWYYPLVSNAALHLHDPKRARLWWDLAQAKKPKVFNGDYWMARSALAWIEGDLDEARSAWAKADEYLRGMPHTGAYEFDRDCLAALKKTIDTDPIVRTPELADSLRG